MAGLGDLRRNAARQADNEIAPASSAPSAKNDLTKGKQPVDAPLPEEQHMETAKKMLSARIGVNLHNDLEMQVVVMKRKVPKLTIQDFVAAMIEVSVENPQIITLIQEKCRDNYGRK